MGRLISVAIMVTCLAGCATRQAQQDTPRKQHKFEKTIRFSMNGIMDFYKQNCRWPESSAELSAFCDESVPAYSESDRDAYSQMGLEPLGDGNLQIEIELPLPHEGDGWRVDPNALAVPTVRLVLTPQGTVLEHPSGVTVIHKSPGKEGAILKERSRIGDGP